MSALVSGVPIHPEWGARCRESRDLSEVGPRKRTFVSRRMLGAMLACNKRRQKLIRADDKGVEIPIKSWRESEGVALVLFSVGVVCTPLIGLLPLVGLFGNPVLVVCGLVIAIRSLRWNKRNGKAIGLALVVCTLLVLILVFDLIISVLIALSIAFLHSSFWQF